MKRPRSLRSLPVRGLSDPSGRPGGTGSSGPGLHEPSGAGSNAAAAAAAVACLGTGTVRHRRLRPAEHAFSYPTGFVLLPMRALRQEPQPALARNHGRLFGFHDRDHGDGGDDALAWAEALLAREGVPVAADSEIWLQTFPRVAGYAFKPVSFWLVVRRDGSLQAVLAEVNNTFAERHCYLLAGPDVAWGATLSADKVFHVSPFCAVQGRYRFRFALTWQTAPAAIAGNGPQGLPGTLTPDRLVARVEHDGPDGPLIVTSISGRLEPLTASAIRRFLWRTPLLTLGVFVRIHWQALALWRKRVPYFTKPQPPLAEVSR